MQAFRVYANPTDRQLIIDLPPELGHQLLEVIVMPASDQQKGSDTQPQRRKPSPRLAGTVTMQDDLIAPAASETEWESLK
jgi:hypothetical protein